MMEDNERIKSLLRSAGVPREAFSTTLKIQGLEEMREYVINKAYTDHPLVYLYPSKTKHEKSVEKAELCLYLMIKELIISGVNSYACHLVDIHTALYKDTDEAEAISERLVSDFVGIDKFHDRGGRVEQFMTQYEIQYFNSWLIRRHNSEKGTILLGAAPLSECDDWWPASMLGYIRSRAVAFEIKG